MHQADSIQEFTTFIKGIHSDADENNQPELAAIQASLEKNDPHISALHHAYQQDQQSKAYQLRQLLDWCLNQLYRWVINPIKRMLHLEEHPNFTFSKDYLIQINRLRILQHFSTTPPHRAESKIQASIQGNLARHALQLQHTAAIALQRVHRVILARLAWARTSAAAVKLQSASRRIIIRRALKLPMLVIFNNRHTLTLQHTLAVKLQATIRGKLARQVLKLQHTAAIILQSASRRMSINQTLHHFKAAVTMQTTRRSHVTKRAWQHTKTTAVKLQAAIRGHLTRQALHQQHTAATVQKANQDSLTPTLAQTNTAARKEPSSQPTISGDENLPLNTSPLQSKTPTLTTTQDTKTPQFTPLTKLSQKEF